MWREAMWRDYAEREAVRQNTRVEADNGGCYMMPRCSSGRCDKNSESEFRKNWKCSQRH